MLKEKSQLLVGAPGLNMLIDALEFAKAYLKKEEPDKHPDYLYVGPAPGKSSMGVEEAKLVDKKASLRPSIAAKQVIIIDGIDLMNEAGQNKLLKTLEDSDAIILVISYGGRVLDTVRSRLEVVFYRPLCREDFLNEIKGVEPDLHNGGILFAASKGCPMIAEQLVTYLPRFKQIIETVNTNNLPQILPAMALLNEKDKDSVAESHDRIYFINFLLSVFMEQLEYSMTGVMPDYAMSAANPSYTPEQLITVLKLLMEHQRICQRQTYSKNNFFQLIVGIIESK